MKALTLRQPWASLVGPKRHETRNWPTNYRGPLAIHASASFGQAERDACLSENIRPILVKMGLLAFEGERTTDPVFYLPRGAFVSTCWLLDCVATERCVTGATPEERHMVDAIDFLLGDYSPKRFAFELGMFQKLSEPLPFKGKQRWFEVDDALIMPLQQPVIEYAKLIDEIKRAKKGQ